MQKTLGFSAGLLAAISLSGVAWGQAMSSPVAPTPPKDGVLRSAPQIPAPVTRKWVHIRSVADLDQLRDTNFDHYLRAQEILAAANDICQPGPPGTGRTYPARFNGDYLSCSGWMTSNPPKTVLTFHLDDVGYIALVSVTLNGTKLVPLNAQATTTK